MGEGLKIYALADLPRERRLHEGRMERWSIRTQHAQIVFGTITPQPLGQQGNHRDPHDHPFDMLLVVLKGTMMQEVEGVDYKIEAGSAMIVPPFYMHRGYAYGPEPAFLFEVFAPARRDYIDLVEYQTEFKDKGEDWVKEGTFTTTPFTKNDSSKGPLPLYRLSEIPAETLDGASRLQRRSLRTKFAQVIWTDVTPQDQAQPRNGAGFETFQYDKLIIVMQGAARVRTKEHDYALPGGSFVVVPPRTTHALEFDSEVPTSLIEVYAPVRRELLPLVEHQSEKFGDQGEVWAGSA